MPRSISGCSWSIPACTGNPPDQLLKRSADQVYPRVYGESLVLDHCDNYLRGLSPRVRGIQTGLPWAMPTMRSIPACTGNPVVELLDASLRAVYPRVYGESVIGPREYRR